MPMTRRRGGDICELCFWKKQILIADANDKKKEKEETAVAVCLFWKETTMMH